MIAPTEPIKKRLWYSKGDFIKRKILFNALFMKIVTNPSSILILNLLLLLEFLNQTKTNENN